MIPESVILIDTGHAVARQLQRLLGQQNLLAEGPAQETVFWTSADPTNFGNILPALWKKSDSVRSFGL